MAKGVVAPGNRATGRTQGGKKGHAALLHAVRAEAASLRQEVRLDVNPVDALQEVLDGAVADLRLATVKSGELEEGDIWRDTMVGRIPNEWIRYRDDMRTHVERIANNMVRNGIAERAVRVEEARIALFVTAVQQAAEKVGLSKPQVRQLGSALREQLADLQEAAAA